MHQIICDGFYSRLILRSISLEITVPLTDKLASRQSPSLTGAMFSGVPDSSRSPSPRVIPAVSSKNLIC